VGVGTAGGADDRAVVGAGVAGAAAGAAGLAAAGAAAGAVAGAAAGAPAVAVSSISPSTSSTWTTSPSFTACLVSTPARSAGTSTVILSVSSSRTVSPAFIGSPCCLTQRGTVASTMDYSRGGTFKALISGILMFVSKYIPSLST